MSLSLSVEAQRFSTYMSKNGNFAIIRSQVFLLWLTDDLFPCTSWSWQCVFNGISAPTEPFVPRMATASEQDEKWA